MVCADRYGIVSNGPAYIGYLVYLILNLGKGCFGCAAYLVDALERTVRKPIGCVRGDKWFDIRPDMAVVGLLVVLHKPDERIVSHATNPFWCISSSSLGRAAKS